MKAFLLTALLLASTAVQAHDFEKDDLVIVHPVALSTSVDADKATETIGYFKVRNTSKQADRLLSISAPETSELIQINILPVDEPGVAKQAVSALDIPGKQETALTPNGNHILFSKLKTPLAADYSFPATLTFERAGDIPVIFSVESASEPQIHN